MLVRQTGESPSVGYVRSPAWYGETRRYKEKRFRLVTSTLPEIVPLPLPDRALDSRDAEIPSSPNQVIVVSQEPPNAWRVESVYRSRDFELAKYSGLSRNNFGYY